MLTLRQWVLGSRPKTLLVGISGVLVGTFSAVYAARDSGVKIEPVFFTVVAVLCALVAGFLQIAVNFANDYSDGIRGTDSRRAAERVATAEAASVSASLPSSVETVSGPARLAASGVSPRAVLAAAGISAGIACAAGLTAVIMTGRYWLIALGILCVLAAWFYTGGKHPYGYAGGGEIGVFLFFGIAVVLGTQFALLGVVTGMGVLGGVSQGCFAVCVMMVNNLRDIETDAVSGKRTMEVKLGWQRSTGLFFAVSLVGLIATAMVGLEAVLKGEAGNGFLMAFLLFWFATGFLSLRSWQFAKFKQFRRALPMASCACLLNAIVFIFVGLFS